MIMELVETERGNAQSHFFNLLLSSEDCAIIINFGYGVDCDSQARIGSDGRGDPRSSNTGVRLS